MRTLRKQPLQVVYVPGLGDIHNGRPQYLLTRLWRLYGVTTYYFPVGWNDDEPFTQKLDRLLQLIDKLSKNGRVMLFGTSAGASLAINAFAKTQEQIDGVVLLCGKINNPHTISKQRYWQNPAFEASMNMVASSLATLSPQQRANILSMKPLADVIVPPADTFIEGSRSKTVFMWGHSVSIVFALIFYGFSISRFLKRRPSL